MSSSKLQELQKFSVRELKEKCRESKMKVGGTKGQLLLRLCGMEKEKPKASRRMSVQAVNKWLEREGVNDTERVSKCLRAGIQKGYVGISGDSPLDNVFAEGQCSACGNDIKATIRDLLYQPDYAGLDYEEGGLEATVKCPDGDCGVGVYVTRICSGSHEMDCGKFHNHCTACPGFGKCIGDYREEHCTSCGKHFFAGLSGQFPCSCTRSASEMFFPFF
ncbi:uncharacterized protein [Antedon mediterranea]|uniref:uncharacterized protein n=1 Tax=Antedon mediterranea TaxID=105859 RepID=UPI003AF67D0F